MPNTLPLQMPVAGEPPAETSARILLVDDEHSVQTLLAYPLRKAGYEVVSARDGREALDRFAEGRFDLVVLDIMLPKLDGIEVCRRLRSRSQVPIIMLTAKDDEGDKVLGLEMGADDYITKPFSVREFRSRVKAALRRSEMLRARAPSSEPIEAGDLRVDFERRAVTARGEPVTLTFVEFEILTALAAAPGKVLTRESLLEQVWGDSAYRDPRTIDVHIRHLREKIERDPRTPEYLFTVGGRLPLPRVGVLRHAITSRLAASEDEVGDERPTVTSVRNRLALLFFVIVAAAVGFIYLYVVPQLRSNLTVEKLRQLETDGVRRGREARGRDVAGGGRGRAAGADPGDLDPHRVARHRPRGAPRPDRAGARVRGRRLGGGAERRGPGLPGRGHRGRRRRPDGERGRAGRRRADRRDGDRDPRAGRRAELGDGAVDRSRGRRRERRPDPPPDPDRGPDRADRGAGRRLARRSRPRPAAAPPRAGGREGRRRRLQRRRSRSTRPTRSASSR